MASDPTVIGRKKKRIAPQPPGNFKKSKRQIYMIQIFFPGHFSEEDLSAQELIDFSPIYRGLHIAHVLGRSSIFETYYRAERTKQARLVLQPPTNMVCYEIYNSNCGSNYLFVFSMNLKRVTEITFIQFWDFSY